MAEENTKKRGIGSLEQLRRVLWGTIKRLQGIQKQHSNDIDVVVKTSHAISQLAGQYRYTTESADLEGRIEAIEQNLNGKS